MRRPRSKKRPKTDVIPQQIEAFNWPRPPTSLRTRQGDGGILISTRLSRKRSSLSFGPPRFRSAVAFVAASSGLDMSARQQQDEATKRRIKRAPNSRATLEALLAEKETLSSRPSPSESGDPIAQAMRQLACLIRKVAGVRALGFPYSLLKHSK